MAAEQEEIEDVAAGAEAPTAEVPDTPAADPGPTLANGESVTFVKGEHDLSELTFGFGWKVTVVKKPFYLRFFSKNKTVDPDDDGAFDLDLIAFLCGDDGKVAGAIDPATGRVVLLNEDVVFYNKKFHKSGRVWLTTDDRTGGDGSTDNEQIVAQLDALPSQYRKIVFVVQIYRGIRRGESLEKIDTAFLRVAERGGKELLRCEFGGDPTYANACSLLLGEIERAGDDWQFRVIARAYPSDSFADILREYGNPVSPPPVPTQPATEASEPAAPAPSSATEVQAA